MQEEGGNRRGRGKQAAEVRRSGNKRRGKKECITLLGALRERWADEPALLCCFNATTSQCKLCDVKEPPGLSEAPFASHGNTELPDKRPSSSAAETSH